MEDGVQLQRKCFGCGCGDAGCNGSQMGQGGGVCKREREVEGTGHAAAERNYKGSDLIRVMGYKWVTGRN